jgi:hypothetical protein
MGMIQRQRDRRVLQMLSFIERDWGKGYLGGCLDIQEEYRGTKYFFPSHDYKTGGGGIRESE